MSSRYGGRGYGRYGDPEDDRTAEDRFYERDAERGYGPSSVRPERGSDYGISRRGGYSAMRGGGYEREYGQERDHDPRDPGTREYTSRYGREVLERGGYAGSARRHEGEDYGRAYGVRTYGRDYERRAERPYKRDDEGDEVREYDTDYGRTTSRFYGRTGYEYGRDDYEDDRGRPAARGDEGDGGSWLDRAADQVRSWFGSDDDPEGVRRADDARRMHARGEGKFRGRGPKNYRRSDERLREVVCDRLTDNEWLDASDVECNVVAGEVILTGSVDSRYAKRLAENIAESVSGVANVQNNLRVQSYQAGMDAPLPTGATATLPPSDITATNDTTAVSSPDSTDANISDRPSSRAAGRS